MDWIYYQILHGLGERGEPKKLNHGLGKWMNVPTPKIHQSRTKRYHACFVLPELKTNSPTPVPTVKPVKPTTERGFCLDEIFKISQFRKIQKFQNFGCFAKIGCFLKIHKMVLMHWILPSSNTDAAYS